MRLPAVLLCVAYVVVAVFFAWTLVNHDYEAEYLALGDLALRGEISLYQDEMTGQWVPLPFIFYGAVQALAGRDLLVPRLASVALGLGVLVLVWALARRAHGTLAAAVAAGLFVTNGLVVGYFSTVHFAGLAALCHLLALWILFGTTWPTRDVLAMLVVSVLFLVKPNYWPTIPIVLVYLAARAPARRWPALVAAAVAIPLLFFVSARDHLKLLAFVPVARDWVAPLGYTGWFSLVADPGAFWGSDYVDIKVGSGVTGRLVQIASSLPLLFKRYALWTALLAVLGVAALVTRGRASVPDPGRGELVRMAAWLFGLVTAAQFVLMGPFTKQAFGYVGAIAPLFCVVLGVLYATVWDRVGGAPAARAAMVVGLVACLAASPWVHRHPNLPRRVRVAEATIPDIRRVSAELAAVLPAGESRIFLLGDPLALHLAGRRSYLRQFHQWWIVFTSEADASKYARAGLWGRAELERWLGGDARYAVVERRAEEYYRRRAPYREVMARMDALLAERFAVRRTIDTSTGDRFVVYARR